MTSQQAHDRAEAAFRKTKAPLVGGGKAMADSDAQCFALREKTARLKALRLARDMAGALDTAVRLK